MTANGETIKCMEKALLNGLMAESIQVSTTKIKNMGMDESNGLMVRYTKVNGAKVSRMDKEK